MYCLLSVSLSACLIPTDFEKGLPTMSRTISSGDLIIKVRLTQIRDVITTWTPSAIQRKKDKAEVNTSQTRLFQKHGDDPCRHQWGRILAMWCIVLILAAGQSHIIFVFCCVDTALQLFGMTMRVNPKSYPQSCDRLIWNSVCWCSEAKLRKNTLSWHCTVCVSTNRVCRRCQDWQLLTGYCCICLRVARAPCLLDIFISQRNVRSPKVTVIMQLWL